MSIKNYFCAKCGVCQQNMYTPNLQGCRKGGQHYWRTFMRGGRSHAYRCRKCGERKIETNHIPLIPNCRAGGNHSWEKIQ